MKRFLPSGVFFRFLAAGVIAAAVNIGARILFNRYVSYECALVLAYFCGMVTAFIINRQFVFTHTSGFGAGRQSVRFALVNLLALAQVWIVSVGLARWVFPYLGMAWHADTVAHVIAVASPTVTSYLGHKHFSFARA